MQNVKRYDPRYYTNMFISLYYLSPNEIQRKKSK